MFNILLLQHQQAYVLQFFLQVPWKHQCLSSVSMEPFNSKGFIIWIQEMYSDFLFELYIPFISSTLENTMGT